MRTEHPSSSLPPLLTPTLSVTSAAEAFDRFEPVGTPQPAGARARITTLADAHLGEPQVVVAVHAPAAAPEWAGWLEEIGFLPGERVMLMARAALGGDPLVVRIGQSTFALRAAEAACVELIAAP